MWILYELPDLSSAVHHASFYPCGVSGACHSPEPWPVSWFTAMFMHGSWDHILGNMLFLATFGKNVEDAFGRGRYLAFDCAGGFAANAMQTGMTLAFGSAATAKVPVPQAVRSPPCSARTSSSYPGSRALTGRLR